MAAEITSDNVTAASPPPAHVIGKAFVEQYYNILHDSPGMVHRFYQDSSILGRPDHDGVMSSVTTMQAINEKVMSQNYEEYMFQIETVDAQHSYKEGVTVLVTGCIIGNSNPRQKFTQSFFLAPQDKGGYFVLNDVFRYVGEIETGEDNNMLDNDTIDFADNTHASSNPATTNPISEEDVENGEEDLNEYENEGSVVEEETPDQPPQPSQLAALPAAEVTTIQEDAPKKSYASIVKVTSGNSTASTSYVSPAKAKVLPAKTEKQAPAAATPVPVSDAVPPSRNDVHESSNHLEEVEGYSIYVRNLPLNATPAQLEEEFKKFGPIKPGGVQVRNHRQYGYCFGFVEFESESSMQTAIGAAPVLMGSQRVVVEEKRTTTRVVDGGSSYANGRGQLLLGRGGFRNESRVRNDNFRGRGGFSGVQGYGRNEFRVRGGFSGRGRGPSARGSMIYQNGGRNFRPTGMNQIAVPA